jgi:hypothetical protein
MDTAPIVYRPAFQTDPLAAALDQVKEERQVVGPLRLDYGVSGRLAIPRPSPHPRRS